jgi:hypothetical protein|tara:strand:+ start:197 stop:358 length:162 start_codon:yes stop_codon:yes gene_type:complete
METLKYGNTVFAYPRPLGVYLDEGADRRIHNAIIPGLCELDPDKLVEMNKEDI